MGSALLSLFRQWLSRHHIDLIESIRVTLDALLLPLIITVNLAVLGQLVAFSFVGGLPIVKVNQVIAIASASALCLGSLAMLRSLILLRRPNTYVWLRQAATQVESQAWLRAVPVDGFSDGVIVCPLGAFRHERVENGGFCLFQIGQGEGAFRRLPFLSRSWNWRRPPLTVA